ncbi:MAG: translation initiation factor IF-2 [Ruminococcus sp.]|nr:translation initiation factor IF-2 [Ruminococcus sp.]
MKNSTVKLNQLAKDLGLTNNDLIECLGTLGGDVKKAMSALTEDEISFVFEYFTQKTALKDLSPYFENNVAPAPKEKKPAKEKKAEPEKKPAAVKEEKKTEEKKPEPEKQTKKPEADKEKTKAEKFDTAKAINQSKQEKKAKKEKKHDHGRQQLLGGGSSNESSTGYTVSEESSGSNRRIVDTRGSYTELDKYNEKYDNMASSKQGGGKDNYSKKQKLTQKSQQYKKQKGSHGKREFESEKDKLRRLELERARKQQLKVLIPDEIVVSELASRLKVTATEVIKKLMGLGVMASINEVIDFDTAALVADELGAKVEKEVIVTIEERLIEDEEDKEEDLVERCPVVVVMGHVDHGKTSILDRIRHANVAAGEAGGITQHIGAYQVRYNGKKITFLDTPGHEAFTSMRARGANITDIAILVVAADDGIMPQTIESINHAKAAGVSIIVAINKMDKEGADPDRVKQQLTEHELVVEEWGGDVIAVPVSAKTGEGIDELLENVLLVAEVKELKANPNRLAKGTVIEARLDKGKGPVATVLVENGTLNSGDVIIAGTAVGRIRTMTDYHSKSINKAGPSTPVEITGLAEVPSAGDVFNAVEDEKLARELVEQRKHDAKEEQFAQYHKVTLENLFSQISEGEMKELPIIVKADVQGSVEAVKQSLEKLSNDEVRVKVIHGGVGAVSESDVMLANASNALIVGFNVRPDPVAKENAKRDGVDIRLYRIIYDAIEEITDAMKGMLAPKFREVETARIEVRQVYKITGVGNVAGAYVLEGKIGRSDEIRVVRDGIVIAEDKMSTLKRFKDDVKEVASGFECGITLEKFSDIKEGDIFEAFVMEEYRD